MRVAFYQVGGSVRDEVLNLTPKDIDYAVEVLDRDPTSKVPAFDIMYEAIKTRGGDIKVTAPDLCRLKATFPESFGESTYRRDQVSDFALCLKGYPEFGGGVPKDKTPGTIFDDLAHRDFTMNALAKSEHGSIIDPHGGVRDIRTRTIRTVGRAEDRFSEDGLRLVRALRFSLTKGFALSGEITTLFQKPTFFEPLLAKLNVERVREELTKCFKHGTLETLTALDMYRGFRNALFRTSYRGGTQRPLWLKPTIEDK